jgi:hypothetical protein
MQLKLLFSKWTQVAGLLLIGGAIAWTIKLAVIIATDGRIITTGAAALLMKIGIVLLVLGSTGIGNRLSLNRNLLLRAIAIILSPVVAFGTLLLFGTIINPILNPVLANSGVWYAQQEAPIALAVVFFLAVGYLLYRSYKPLAQ